MVVPELLVSLPVKQSTTQVAVALVVDLPQDHPTEMVLHIDSMEDLEDQAVVAVVDMLHAVRDLFIHKMLRPIQEAAEVEDRP
jgi:hypothetical protein